VIEAFCVAGLAGRASSTRGTYRSALYRLAEAVHGPAGQRATPFAGARAPVPYSPAERAELAAAAAAQRDPVTRSSALAMVVSGAGAGLRPGELVALRGGDVFRHGRRVMVQVSGPPARVVPVTADYAGRAWQLARRAGSDFVFRPGPAGRGYKNFVTNFARGLAADPAAPQLSVRRAGFASGGLHRTEDGTVVHGEVRMGDAAVWLHAVAEEHEMATPRGSTQSHGGLELIVEDVDAHYARSKAAGARIQRAPTGQPYGLREYGARDPENHRWWFSSPLTG
jgi:uncharacterized glyoxalase superfamily protein PhnB